MNTFEVDVSFFSYVDIHAKQCASCLGWRGFSALLPDPALLTPRLSPALLQVVSAVAARAVSHQSGNGECRCSERNVGCFSSYRVKSLVFSKGANGYVLVDVVASRKIGESCARGQL